MSYGFYIYYRVSADTAEALRRRVTAMQQSLAISFGTPGRLLNKVEEPLLWMEVYEGIADCAAFSRALEVALAEHRVIELLPASARKVEIFSA